MNLTIGNNEHYLTNIKKKYEKFTNLWCKKNIEDGYFYHKCNKINTYFLKTEIDIIGINEDNIVIYIYRDVPKNKTLEIYNDEKNTSIIVLPKNTSKNIKINYILSLVYEDII